MNNPEPIISPLLVAETAAAISDQVHSDPTKYRILYDRIARDVSGFPGIWSLIAECAVELERQHPEPWEDGWIETCWAIGTLILDLESRVAAADLVSQSLKSQTQQPQPKESL